MITARQGDGGGVDAVEAAVTVVLVCAPASGLPAALAVDGLMLLARTDDTDAAPRLVAEQQPQVAVVDLDTGGGPEAIAAITAAAPDARVLAVSARTDAAPTAEALAAVRAGAAGYLVRPGSAAELVRSVRRVADGEAVFSAGLADVVLAAHGDPAAAATLLTDRESDVLRLVVEGLTARQIATRLVLSPRTVENHVQRVLGKLGLRGRAALVRYAIEHGLA
jgi:DNA-binding NarL/FixJ family response regulator